MSEQEIEEGYRQFRVVYYDENKEVAVYYENSFVFDKDHLKAKLAELRETIKENHGESSTILKISHTPCANEDIHL